jgi:hypothetical protein
MIEIAILLALLPLALLADVLRITAFIMGICGGLVSLALRLLRLVVGLVVFLLRLVLGALRVAAALLWWVLAVLIYENLARISRNMTPLEQNLCRASHGVAWPVVLIIIGLGAVAEFGWPSWWYAGIAPAAAVTALCAGMAVTGSRRAAGARDAMLATRAGVKASVGLAVLLWAYMTLALPDAALRAVLASVPCWLLVTGLVRLALLLWPRQEPVIPVEPPEWVTDFADPEEVFRNLG